MAIVEFHSLAKLELHSFGVKSLPFCGKAWFELPVRPGHNEEVKDEWLKSQVGDVCVSSGVPEAEKL